jgi:Flp pilus assembly protein TadG
MKMKGFAAFRNHRRAVAAVEFAIIAPFLALVLAAATDYGLREWSRSCLVNAVAQGAYYAFLTGPTVNVGNVQTLVEKASSRSGININTTTATAVGCYCPSGTPASLGAPVSTVLPCTYTCSDTTNAGTYLSITATYTLISLISYSGLAGQSLSETAIVRLQ